MNWSPFGAIIGESLQPISDNIRKRVITRFEEGAFPLRFYLTDTEFEVMKELMAPRPITYDNPKSPLRRHPHPVPAELQRYAYEKCIDHSKKFKRAIDIGGTPLRTPKGHHLCTLINDTRTETRYVNAFLQVDGTTCGLRHLCKNGAQKCDVKAPYAYMINVYDIPIEEIPYIMERHQCLVLDIWMFFPCNLISKHYTADQTFYKNEIVEHRGLTSCCRKLYCRFDLNDSSNAYYHDYKNWKKYLCTTQAKGKFYNYNFEHIEQLGTFTNIRVTRSESPINQHVYRVLNIAPNDKSYLVPDVMFYWTVMRAAGNMFHRVFLVEKNFVDAALKWCQRIADNAFNYPSFASQFDAKSISVYYTVEKQQRLIYKGLTMDHDEYERLQISLYMIGAVNRFKRTQHVGNMFKFLRNCDNSFWDRFKHCISRLFVSADHKISASLRGHSVTHYLDHISTQSNTYMPDLRIKCLPRYVVNGIITTDGYCKTDATFLDMPDFELIDYDLEDDTDKKSDDRDDKKTEDKPDKTEDDKKLPDKSKDPNKHSKMIYDPPGDGQCGLHAMKYLCRKLCAGKMLSIPKRVEVDLQMHKLSDDNHDAYELAYVARQNGFNLIVHVAKDKHNHLEKGIYRFIYSHDWPTMKLDLVSGHYYAVDCDCDNTYIGDYRVIPVHTDGLYVNCANENLTDGAGQAQAFRLLFPGYDTKISKPVPPVSFHPYNGTHLCLAVALNANVKSNTKAAQQARLKQIFDAIDLYATTNGLTVYMPLIGTALFGNDLCCVKRLYENLKCRKVLCLFNNEQRMNYHNTHKCAHGGFKTLGHGRPLTSARTKYDPSNWMLIAPTMVPQKMEIKYRDIEDITIKSRCDRIVELSCAPGHFYGIHNKKVQYVACHYTKGEFQLMKGVVAHPWSKYDELPKLQDGDMVLLDYAAAPGDPFFDYCLEQLEELDIKITCKFQAYTDDEEKQAFENYLFDKFDAYHIHVWRNDGSEMTSSEVYYTISDIAGVPAKLDLAKKIQEVDHDNMAKQIKTGCVCKGNKPDLINAQLTWKSDANQFKQFKKNLVQNSYIKENLTDEEVEAVMNCEMFEGEIGARLGVAGSGKSKVVLDNFCGYCSLIIAPLRIVTMEHDSKIKQKIALTDSRAVTFIKAIKLLLLRGPTFQNIFVDEIFLVNPYFLDIYQSLAPNATIVALGDPYQIKTDFEGTAPDYVIEETGKYVNASKRCPVAVEKYIKGYIPEFRANPSRPGKIQNMPFNKDSMHRTNGDAMLCATQEMKKFLMDKFEQPRVYTIHEAMGGTYDRVHIVTTDIDKIHTNKVTYVYTAMSRTTDTLVMYGNEEQIQHFFSIITAPIERTLNAPMAEVIPVNETVVTEVVENEPLTEKLTSLDNDTTNLDSVRGILAKVYPKKNDYIDRKTLDIRINLIKGPESGEHLSFPAGLLDASDVKVNGRMIGEPLVKYYHGNDKLGTLNTINARYMSKQLSPSQRMYNKLLDAHYDGICKFLKPPNQRAKLIFDQEKVYEGVRDYLIKLQDKFRSRIGPEEAKYICEIELKFYNYLAKDTNLKNIVSNFINDFMSKDSSIDKIRANYEQMVSDYMATASAEERQNFEEINSEWYDVGNAKVKFHMKNQPKEIREMFWDTSDKAGQGISAWTKMANAIISTMQQQFHEWMQDSLLDNVMWAVDRSDREIAEEFKSRGMAEHMSDARAQTISIDASEFDQSQKHVGNVAINNLAKAAGAPPKTVDYYQHQREKWSATAMFNVDQAVQHANFVARHRMTSGHKMTLTGNTTYDMSIIGGEFKYSNIRFAMFKGDDSVVCCDKHQPILYEGKRLSEWCNYKLKIAIDDVPEFIANFLTPWGFFPDVLRRTSRVVGRIVTHPEQWEEMRRSIADCMSVINNNAELHLGTLAAVKHYTDKGLDITYEEINTLLAFLRRAIWDDSMAPTVTGEWNILYYDITRMLDGMSGQLNTYYRK